MCLVSHGKCLICSLIIDFNNPQSVLPVVSNAVCHLSLNTSTILCKIDNCMSLGGEKTLFALFAAMFALPSAFDKRVTRNLLLAALDRVLAVKAIVVVAL
jgi:hypothetical protein